MRNLAELPGDDVQAALLMVSGVDSDTESECVIDASHEGNGIARSRERHSGRSS